ncbi:hypothetical protein BUALT_Bualt01G0007300 [Buddleja alternifolia]|uniref:C2 domain-containing protein n=1 Tax=Buddleja alternifolia TaxID=168488 RepID=A0AAV6Y5M2_9LAMI|nr:hypothetical protein BUALT_Bualt01G0007300 [Buddleja alternifolia]
MECRKFEITLVSANSLPDVRSFRQMKVFAKVSIEGELKTSKKTPVDMVGKTNPRWNFPIEYTINDSAVQKSGMNLSIKLFCRRTFADRYVGEVNIPIKSLFDKGVKADKILSYGVDGTSYGRLNILYSFGEKFLVSNDSDLDWKSALEVGFLVLLGGVVLLLEDDDDDDAPALQSSSNVHIVELDGDDEDDFFYDAGDMNSQHADDDSESKSKNFGILFCFFLIYLIVNYFICSTS